MNNNDNRANMVGMKLNDSEKDMILDVIQFLRENEQYGDDWGEQIELLYKIVNV